MKWYAEKESEKRQNKDREEKTETISTKPFNTNTDVTNRVSITGDSIVKHIRGYVNYHKEFKTVKFLQKASLVQR